MKLLFRLLNPNIEVKILSSCIVAACFLSYIESLKLLNNIHLKNFREYISYCNSVVAIIY